MTDSKISIIIPAFNLEDCLGSTLESVQAQTYGNIQIIVVDDGSADATWDVILRYAARDGRIVPIRQENGGVTAARLRGVAEATGAWIGFVDGDDYIEPDMYERLLDNARKHDADISHCGYRMVFPNGKVDYYYNTGTLLCQNREDALKELISGNRVEPGLCNKLFRRELFRELLEENRMPRDIKNYEDLLMNFYLFRQAKTSVWEDFCPYHYVLRRGSAATAKLNRHKLEDPLKVIHILREEVPDTLRDAALTRLARQLVDGATRPLGDQPELIRPFRTRCRRELRKELWGILGSGCEMRMKYMALWAAVWPGSYGWVHRVYAGARGVDKKYQID